MSQKQHIQLFFYVLSPSGAMHFQEVKKKERCSLCMCVESKCKSIGAGLLTGDSAGPGPEMCQSKTKGQASRDRGTLSVVPGIE